MAIWRWIACILVLGLALSGCSPAQPANPAVTLTAPSVTVAPAAATLVPTQTAAPSPTATPTSTPAPTEIPSPTAQPSSTTAATTFTERSLDCATYNDPKVKITVPKDIGPYILLCGSIFGTVGVEITAMGTDFKIANRAVFTNPLKVCLKGSGPVMYLDLFGGGGAQGMLKTTQENGFTCVDLTRPGSVLFGG